jgi:hypothetical protein
MVAGLSLIRIILLKGIIVMAQKAILKFVKADKITLDVIKISNGEYESTHHGIKANDFIGTNDSSYGHCEYLLAPFDCVVKAIRDFDNTVFFESLSEVETPSGVKSHVSFTCTHMEDDDKVDLGVGLNAVFIQGEPCYREGEKGYANGAHIHMNQAFGAFRGGTSPSVAFTHNGSTQYVINADNESSVYETFFKGCEEVPGGFTTSPTYSWTELEDDSTVIEPENPEEPETPVEHQTMRLTMTVPTISPNRYPTRPSVNGTYNPNTYFINTGDVVVISDIKAASDGNVVCQIADCLTDGVSSSVLNGRWFVYDKDNFN